jgi:16S rRNA (adenine1518-N6/adenine1519-N6)-dimethyltransferase
VKRPPLGQHFLNRASILDRIADAACPRPEHLVIEIGPGEGSLTVHLMERAARIVAIEVDPALAERLRARFAGHSHFEVVHADVLDLDLAQWGPAVVVGNLPYYITSPILDRALAMGPILTRAVFLMQKEVADRLSAQPGCRDYGFLTVRTRFRAWARTLFYVPPSAFSPPPKVESAVVQLDPRAPEEALPVGDAERFLEFVGLCFRQKRKTIRNNLVGAFPREAIDACREAGLRAEQLTIEEFADLYQRLAP